MIRRWSSLNRRRQGTRGGGALVAAILLSLAMLLMTHGVLVLATAELRAATARGEHARARIRLRSTLAVSIRDSLGGAARAAPVDSVVSMPDVADVGRRLRRLAPEVWLVEVVDLAPASIGSLALPVFVLDPVDRPGGLPIGSGGWSAGPFALGPLTHMQIAERLTVLAPAPVTPGPEVVGGRCIVSAPLNWGDPSDPTGPCGDHRVALRVEGDLGLSGGTGQGVLFVDGDVDAVGVDFRGVVAATGVVVVREGARLSGWVHGDRGVTTRDSAAVSASSEDATNALLLPPFRRPFVLRPVRWLRRER